MNFTNKLAIPVIAATLLSPLAAYAGENTAEKAIRERISALETAWAKGDTKFVATQVYGSDAIIHGEGQKELVHTPAGVQAVVDHLVADSKSVKLDVHSIKTLGPNAANSWVTWHVTPKAAGEKPFDVRALFVWTKGKDGWRIRADMYSFGSM